MPKLDYVDDQEEMENIKSYVPQNREIVKSENPYSNYNVSNVTNKLNNPTSIFLFLLLIY